VTDSEKIDLLLAELAGVKGEIFGVKEAISKTVLPALNRIEKKVNLVAEALLSPREVQQLRKIV
jgi:hypothetical protein